MFRNAIEKQMLKEVSEYFNIDIQDLEKAIRYCRIIKRYRENTSNNGSLTIIKLEDNNTWLALL